MCRSRGREIGDGTVSGSDRPPVRPIRRGGRKRAGPGSDRYSMPTESFRARTDRGDHFSCSMSSVLLARVDAFGGPEAVDEVLWRAGSQRTHEYLSDATNWIAYDEAVALWQAGAIVTHHPQFAHAVGEDTAQRMGSSQVAAMLRSLGSPEHVFRAIATGAAEFTTVTQLEVIDAAPGFAEVVATAAPGFPRSIEHCGWTSGLMSCPSALFGLGPASVGHEECQAMGAERCVYHVRWEVSSEDESPSSEHAGEGAALRPQVGAMRDRLSRGFATAPGPVRVNSNGDLHCHHKGFDEDEIPRYVEALGEWEPGAEGGRAPDSWLVAPIRSNRREYGRLLALRRDGATFFPQERELFEVYAQFAASALDGAAALAEAKERGNQASALLSLARTLAIAGTSGEVARRLANAVPLVVDSDRVGVCLWDPTRRELVRRAVTRHGDEVESEPAVWVPEPGGWLDRMMTGSIDAPLFVDDSVDERQFQEMRDQFGIAAAVLVPLKAGGSFLGMLIVSVFDRPERLKMTADLLDRLSGVAAQATTALQNGHLLDEMTHQALHDQLTGLANRLQFTEQLQAAIEDARREVHPVTLLYMDLDGFKPVNDEFGHDVGDQLLVAVAKRLVACTREEDTVARLGGDEFAVLIDSATASADAEAVSERLARSLTDPFVIEGHELRLGVSIGRAVFPIDADDPDGLLRCADAAMFGVKRRTHPLTHPPARVRPLGR